MYNPRKLHHNVSLRFLLFKSLVLENECFLLKSFVDDDWVKCLVSPMSGGILVIWEIL